MTTWKLIPCSAPVRTRPPELVGEPMYSFGSTAKEAVETLGGVAVSIGGVWRLVDNERVRGHYWAVRAPGVEPESGPDGFADDYDEIFAATEEEE